MPTSLPFGEYAFLNAEIGVLFQHKRDNILIFRLMFRARRIHHLFNIGKLKGMEDCLFLKVCERLKTRRILYLLFFRGFVRGGRF